MPLEEEEVKLRQDILKVLMKAKEEIYDCFDRAGFDPSYFNILIDLRCIINDITLRIYEKERSLENE